MRAGQMRHRVQLYERYGSSNEFGEVVDGWQEVAEFWAAVRPSKGSESEFADKIEAETDYEITARYRTDVTPEKRIRYDNKYLEILSVINNNERDRTLLIKCKAVE